MIIFCYVILSCIISSARYFLQPVPQFPKLVFQFFTLLPQELLEPSWFAIVSCLAASSVLAKAVARHGSVKVHTVSAADPCLTDACRHRGHRLYGHHCKCCHQNNSTNFCFLHHVIILLLFQLCYIFVTK